MSKSKNRSSFVLALLILFVLACKCGDTRPTSYNSNNSNNDNSSTSEVKEEPFKGDNVREAFVAKEVAGKYGSAQDEFSPSDSVIYCVVKIKKPKSDVKYKFVWMSIDTPKYGKNQKVYEIPIDADSRSDVFYGKLTNPASWSPGKYKVEVFANSELAARVLYTIN
jgi:hypothetical protein